MKSSRIERLYNTINDWKVIPLYLINTRSVNNLRFYPNLKVSSRICALERIFFIAQRNRNFTIVPKLTFVILKRNTKFYNRTETVICIFTRKYEVYCCTRTATHFLPRNTIFRIVPKRRIFFYHKTWNLDLEPNHHSLFGYEMRNF